jgi:AraC-like DNA-binding protein
VYEERPSRIPGAFVWTSVAGDDPARVLPDGCMDLLWTGAQVLIAGPDTRAELHRAAAGTAMVGLRFASGFGPQVIGVPARHLTDQRVPLDAAWSPTATRQLADQLHASDDPGSVLENHAYQRGALSRGIGDDEQSRWLYYIVQQARLGASTSSIAETVGLTERQLLRRCLPAFGYGTKTLTRIFRMTRAVELARAGATFADTAHRSGYADQAHLARDVKNLAGVSLGQLLAEAGSDAYRSTELPSGS